MTPRSESIKGVLAQEEIHGAVLGNRFRYGAIAIMAIAVLWNTASLVGRGAFINLSAIAGFIAITVIHSIILRKGNHFWIKAFNYITIVADYAVVTGVIVFWTINASPDNLAFTLKNPTNLYYLLPLLMPTFQFRIKYVVFSFSLFMVLHIAMLGLALHLGVPTTEDWSRYVMGDAIILADVIPTRPVLYGLVALTSGLAIRRSLEMLGRLANVEAQKTVLSRYFSPEVAHRITENPEELQSGEKRFVTVLFSDIRGFTTLSENMPPEQLAKLLTAYREQITEIIFRHGGMIDKFIGDAVMAVFGAPESRGKEADASSAVKCAREMLRALPDFNKQNLGSNHRIDIGIGIHSGDVFAGTIGSSNRLEYTVLGDAVNTASRLEGLCKKLDRKLIVSKELVDLAGPTEFESIARVQVRGRNQPVQVFSLVGFPFAANS